MMHSRERAGAECDVRETALQRLDLAFLDGHGPMLLSRERYPATTPPKLLGWDLDQMQMEMWGQVRL